mgnify:CR=1 FL=1
MTARTDINTPTSTVPENMVQGPDRTRRRPWWHHVLSVFMGIVTCTVALATIISAWAGTIDPEDLPVAGVCVMVLPILAPILLAVFVLDIFWWRRSAVIAGVALAVCLPRILSVYPLSWPSGPLPEGDKSRTWTLLSYNCAEWLDLDKKYPNDINPALSYILKTNADIVCIQEADYLCVEHSVRITSKQIDSISRRYPYIIFNDHNQLLLSKHPADALPLGYDRKRYGNGDIAGYRIHINGHVLTIFNIHLQSIGLTDDDKELYSGLTGSSNHPATMVENPLQRVRTDLVSKLSAANVMRARQVKRLVQYIRKFGGINCVVCGDFNDVPGCFALSQIEDQGLRQVYPAVGLGYMHTYNRNSMYFRIDHVLWRGNFVPHSIERGDIRNSDHYPLFTTFVWHDDK